jgi:hypothetical protein
LRARGRAPGRGALRIVRTASRPSPSGAATPESPTRIFVHDLDFFGLDDDPLDRFPDDVADLYVPSARGGIGGEIISGRRGSQCLDHKPLHITCRDSEEGTCSFSAALNQFPTDVVPVAVSPAHRIGRGHSVAVFIENEAAQKGAALDLRPPPLPDVP